LRASISTSSRWQRWPVLQEQMKYTSLCLAIAQSRDRFSRPSSLIVKRLSNDDIGNAPSWSLLLRLAESQSSKSFQSGDISETYSSRYCLLRKRGYLRIVTTT